MPSRFWRASGNALLPGSSVLGAAGGGAFTPASLSPDLWLEAGDLTTLYTDAGITHVTTDGDAVYQWNDKSSAARNAVQPTSITRPIYKTDLTKPSIKFDGVNTGIATSGDVAWADGSGQQWFALSFQSDATTTREIATIKNSGSAYVADVYVDTRAHMEINGSSGFEEDTSAAATIAANTAYVVIGTVTTTTCEAFVNNVSDGAHTLAGTPSTTTGNMRFSGGGSNWAGRLFAFVHGKGTLSSTDRANLQTYLAGLHP